MAAWCCAHLLANAGFRVAMDRRDRARVPAIMLSGPALALIRDIFGEPGLFADLPRIERRVVAWGRETGPVMLPHSAVVVSETELIEGLESASTIEAIESPVFTIRASRPLPPGAEEHCFGSRRACGAAVGLRDEADATSCWIESLEDGWLFLIPNARGSAWLLAVGGALEHMLAQSRVIGPRLDPKEGRAGEFPISPRIASPLYGTDWIACGAAAVGFDPICGDGTANAVREAILASAVIRAIAEGGDAPSLLHYYDARLTTGMLRHVNLCADYYRSGGDGVWWRCELEALERGRRWCTEKLKGAGEPRYQLRGLVLDER